MPSKHLVSHKTLSKSLILTWHKCNVQSKRPISRSLNHSFINNFQNGYLKFKLRMRSIIYIDERQFHLVRLRIKNVKKTASHLLILEGQMHVCPAISHIFLFIV